MAYAFRNILSRFVLVLGVLALLTTIVWAQAGTGELTGLVADPSGAVVANAQVTLTNSATGDKRTTVTTPAGVYRFSALPIVGTYTLEIAPKGFKAVKIANLVMSVGTTVTQDVKLEVGTGSEQVTVEAGAEVIQTSESSLSQLVDRRIWQQMPLQVRNQNSFIELVAGAVPQDGSGTNRGAEVNGTRSGAGSYLVEGTDNNEQGQAGRGQISPYDKGGASTSISPDAIQEYRVITNTYSAEYGKGGGFITDTVLRSGTNSWHGSAFEYNRIQDFTAQDFFSNRSGLIDHLVRNQFGGSLGGPIVKDKTFWFGTGELHRVRQSNPYGPFTVTTQQFTDFIRSGAFQQWNEADPNGFCMRYTGSTCPGAFAQSAGLGPIAGTLLGSPAQHFPLANSSITCSPTCAGGNANLLFSQGLLYPVPVYDSITLNDPQTFDEARWSLKVDHRFSEKDTINGVYLFQDGTYTEQFTGGNNSIGPALIQDGRGQNFGLTWSHTFNPTVLNTFRASYLRHRLDFPAPKGTFGVPGYYTVDGLAEDFGQYGGLPQFFTENQFQYLDSISVIKGKHSFKFGGEYRRTRNGSRFFNDAFGTFYPWGVEDTLTDLAFSDEAEQVLTPGTHYYGGAYLASASVVPSTGQTPDFYRGYRANEFAGFAQDDWRVSSRFTVNLGLRWEYFGPPHNFKSGIDSNFYFGSNVAPFQQQCPNPAVPPVPAFLPCSSVGTTPNQFFPGSSPFYASVANGNFQIRDHEIWNKDTNNFGPRVGFAWDVLGTQKLVVRAGFGVMYDRIYNNLFENIRFNPPYFSNNQVGWATGTGSAVGKISNGPQQYLTFPFTSTPLFAGGAGVVPNPRHMDQNIVSPYYEQTHFGLQWEFAKGWVFEPEYVGTWGRKLTGIVDINTFDGRVSGAGATTRINPNVGSDNFRGNKFDSNYHALQLSVRKTYSSGLSLTGNYTYSKALDELSDAFNNKIGLNPTDNQNIRYDYAPADFDVRHRAVVTIGYELPFMKQNRWIGGWGLNSIVSWQTGHPFSPYSGSSSYDLNKDAKRTDRLVPIVAPVDTVLHGSPAGNPDGTGGYFDISKWANIDPATGAKTPYFSCPASINGGFWCNAPIGRNNIYGPHFANVDFNVSKRFKITEAAGLTLQANFFDLFNHPNFLPPGISSTGGVAGGTNIQSSDFGKSTATAGDNGGHRITQLAVRFDF